MSQRVLPHHFGFSHRGFRLEFAVLDCQSKIDSPASGNASGWVQAGPVQLSPVTKYYLHGDQRIAMRQGDEVYYLHGDHLGSTSLTTDQTGTVVAESRYLPYGEERWTSGTTPTDFGFTSQRNEAGFGLMDYNARYYSPVLGRFISADSIVPEPGNPQDWNRYSYVRDNPLVYTDPTGHLSEEEIKEFFGVDKKEDLEEILGKAVTEQLWGTEFTWGDVLEYDGGSAMLVLFEQGEGTGYYEGGFLGIGGDRSAIRISPHLLRDSETAGLNAALTQKYKDLGYENLPKRWIEHENRYNHVTTTYVDIKTIDEALFYGSAAGPVVEAISFVIGKTAPGPVRIVTWSISAVSTTAGLVDRATGGAVLGNHTEYPVVRPSRPAGYAKTTYHSIAPTGVYGD